MTVGGPMQVRQSANAFVSASSNKHIPPGNPGICMGGGGLADGCVVLFANERHVLRNTRGGRTGLDEDYRLDRTSRAGCVCDGGVVVGFGWVGYPSYEGFIAADVNNEVNLTRPVWDAGAGRGELGYELKLCVGASAKDTDDAMFMAAVVGNRLHLCFRHAPSSPTGVQTMRLVMDFGEGSQASGLGQLLDANQAPWGWSAPLIRRYGSGNYAPNVSSICGVRAGGSTGVSLYGAVRGNLGTTADGMVMQIDSGSRDNAAVLISDAVNCSTDFFDSLRHKAANDSIVKFSATDDATGITAKMTGSPSESATQTVALSPDSRDYTLAFVQWGNAVRGKNESLAFTFEDDGSSVKASEFWGVESSADLLNTYK
jgi:hypothetical protein